MRIETKVRSRDRVRGNVQGYGVPGEGQIDIRHWRPRTLPWHNNVLYSWATAAQKLFRNVQDQRRYYVGGMYIEFDNSGSPVDPTPTIVRSSGLDYYNSLAAPRDYLRVALAATEEATVGDNLLSNQGRYWAQTTGTTGVHGLAFSAGAGSRVYGGALVVYADDDDAAQDILVSRFYFPSASQLVKVVGNQIGLLWRLTFQ